MTSEVPRPGSGVPAPKRAVSGVVVARHISRIAAIFDAAPIGVGVWSVDGQLLHANPVLCDLLDADLIGLQGQSVDAVLPPADAHDVHLHFDEIWHGARNAFAARFVCGGDPDSALLVRAEFTAVYGPAGLPEYLLSQIFDFTPLTENGVTSRPMPVVGMNDTDLPSRGLASVGVPAEVARLRSKLAATEAELAEVHRLFHAVIEVGPIAVVRLDAEGRVTYANGRWAAFIDDHRDRLSGHNWHNLLDAAQLNDVLDRGVDSVDSREPFEIRISSNDRVHLAIDRDEPAADTTYWAVMQVAPVFDSDGESDGWVATVTDVSAEVAADTRADQLAHALDAGTDFLMIAERTGAISYANVAARTRLGVHTDASDRPPSFIMDLLEADSSRHGTSSCTPPCCTVACGTASSCSRR